MASSRRHHLQLNSRYGRRPALLMIVWGLLVVKILSASSRYYIMYVGCRFSVAFFTSSFSTVSFTLGKLPNPTQQQLQYGTPLKLKCCEISFVHNVDSSCPIVLKFCIKHDNITVWWLCVTERWIVDNRGFARLDFKKISGATLYCNSSQVVYIRTVVFSSRKSVNCRWYRHI